MDGAEVDNPQLQITADDNPRLQQPDDAAAGRQSAITAEDDETPEWASRTAQIDDAGVGMTLKHHLPVVIG